MALLVGVPLSGGLAAPARAEVREVELVIEEQRISIGGKLRRALTINGSVPGPTLEFALGDEAVIHVVNRLDEETSIHWHGVLLPVEQDGVPYLTTPPIPPGGRWTYRFPIRHTGTYWYHSHSGLQEQQGVYGALVFRDSSVAPDPPVDREHVVVLSDWTDQATWEVMRTLMTGSEAYAIRKGNLPSLVGAWRAGRLRAYLRQAWVRMPPMDVSDVAYDAFLVNGQPQQVLEGRAGERVLLRIVNAAASSYFHVEFAGGPLELVAADGPLVEPVEIPRLLIAVAETYDARITIPADGRWELRATAQDGSGFASAWLGEGPERRAPAVPSPDLYDMSELLVGALDSVDVRPAPTDLERPVPPYRWLRARVPTRFVPERTPREITLRLTGNMERYLWSFNDRTLAEDSTIRVRKGEILRLVLVNDTMMHHPLHLHGHFFRVLGEAGDHAPLKHTVDVPPMGKRTIEFDASEQGDWFFHCHILYHMDAGMARVFSVNPPEHEPELDASLYPRPWPMAEVTVLSNRTEGMARVMWDREDFGVDWELGYGEHSEREVDVLWSHFVDPNLSTRLGWRHSDGHDAKDRAFAGLAVRLPLLLESTVEVDTQGGVRVGLGRELALTPRWWVMGDGHYDTRSDWEGAAGLRYVVHRLFSLVIQYHSEQRLGVGVTFHY